MRIFVADESIVHEERPHIYGLSLYGGLVCKPEVFASLNQFLIKLKEKYVYPQNLELKWRFESVWENMKRVGLVDSKFTRKNNRALYDSLKADFERAKEEILTEVGGSNLDLVVAIRPNALFNADDAKSVKYSVSSVARKFEVLLTRENDYGIMLADELRRNLSDDEKIRYEYILDLCCNGSYDRNFERLVALVPTISSSISPLHQINDVVLGSMQYYLCEFIKSIRPGSAHQLSEEAKRLMGLFSDRFYKSATGDFTVNSGILMYPLRGSRGPAGRLRTKLENQLGIDFNFK